MCPLGQFEAFVFGESVRPFGADVGYLLAENTGEEVDLENPHPPYIMCNASGGCNDSGSDQAEEAENTVATWTDLIGVVERMGGQRVNDEMLRMDVLVQSSGTYQQVYLMYELMKPDLEFVKIASPVGALPLVDVHNLLRSYGSLTIGGFQCMASDEAGGILTLGSSMPLALLDLSQPVVFMLTLSILGSASQGVSRSIGGFGE